MRKTLYDYQLECVKSIIQGWRDKETPYAQVDTGGGKSLICADIASRSLKQNYRVLCLVPSHELVVQNVNEFISYTEINPGVCSAKLNRFETNHPKIVFATYTSFLRRRTVSGNFDVLIIDEHHIVSNEPTTSYRKIISALQRINPNLKICGLSATPYRMGSGMSHESCVKGKAVFTKQVFSTDITKLIADGRLSHVQSLNSENSVDLNGVKMKGMDYDQELAAVKFDVILKPGVSETKRLFAKHDISTALIYASNIANAQRIVDEWECASECKIAHGGMTNPERKAIVDWLKKGTGKRYIVNVGLFTTGFNFEQLEAVVLFIATKSLAKYKQIVGRCLRAHDNKPCSYVIDFGGNIDEHGPIDATLPPKSKKKHGDPPEKPCLLCNEINLLSAKYCKKCEALFVSENKEGRYSMKSKAQIWQEKHPPTVYYFEGYQQTPYFSLAYSKNSGCKMIKMQFDGIDYHHYIMLDHTGWPKQKSDKFIFDLLKDKQDFYDLNYEKLTVDNLLLLLTESYADFFRPFKSITISPVEGSKFKELSHYELIN